MRTKTLAGELCCWTTLVLAPALLVAAGVAHAQTYSVISEFNGSGGAYPVSNLISDAAGNLYGVTNGGGQTNENRCFADTAEGGESNTCGTVFKLSKNAGGGWTRTVLHEFTGNSDGANPLGTLVLDSAGNLYGTARLGGVNYGGVAFELSPNAGGTWHFTALRSFPDGANDGSGSSGGLVFDSAGNLYGSLESGGNLCTNNPAFCGMVYELSPGASGWTETIIYYFADLSDGMTPVGGLIIDSHGDLFGTTQWGGNLTGSCNAFPWYQGCGTVFKLTPTGSGGWMKSTIHNFADGADGAQPYSGVAFDAAGNLNGTTYLGGDVTDCTQFYIPGCGVVFRLTPNSSGGWTESTIHVFPFSGQGGIWPMGRPVVDAAGNVYGTTTDGGPNFQGIVYKLSQNSSGVWKESVLHGFTASSGAFSYSGLMLDPAGNLYGTTLGGGVQTGCDNGCGVVFEIKP